MIHITLPIEPVAKGRPRITRTGRAYTPKKTVQFERMVQTFAARHRPRSPFECPIRLTAKFIFVRAKRNKTEAHVQKPDLSNLLKGVEDSLNGIIWKDDSQICEYGTGTGKFWDLSPSAKARIELLIEPLTQCST